MPKKNAKSEREHFTRRDWKDEVQDGNTSLGYEEWVEHQLESKKDDWEFETAKGLTTLSFAEWLEEQFAEE